MLACFYGEKEVGCFGQVDYSGSSASVGSIEVEFFYGAGKK